MKPKDYLSQIRKLDILITQKLRELQFLKDYDRLKSIDYSKDRVQTSPPRGAGFENEVARADALEKEIDADISEYFRKCKKIITQIEALDNVIYVQILYKRYVEFKRLGEIAAEMNYGYGYIRNLHGLALNAFEKIHLRTKNVT